MGLFKKLKGTMEDHFHINGPQGSQFVSDSVGSNAPIEARNTSDSLFAILKNAGVAYATPGGGNPEWSGLSGLENSANQADVRSRVAKIKEGTAGFDGSSPPTPGTINDIHICHTSGGNYTAGRLYLDDGSTLQEVPPAWYGFMVTDLAVSGSVNYDANWLYSWNGSGWEKECDSGAVTNGIGLIKVPFSHATGSVSSSTTIPADAVVTECIVDITTTESAVTVAVDVNSQTIMATDENDPDYAHSYSVEQTTTITTGDNVNVTLGGSPASIVGVAWVKYGNPSS